MDTKLLIIKEEIQENFSLLNHSFDCIILVNYCENLIEFILNNSETNNKDQLKIIEAFNKKINGSMTDSIKHSKNINFDHEKLIDEEIFSQNQWSCLKCTYLNDSDTKICIICLNPKDFQSSNVVFI